MGGERVRRGGPRTRGRGVDALAGSRLPARPVRVLTRAPPRRSAREAPFAQSASEADYEFDFAMLAPFFVRNEKFRKHN
jgi:hypothetical protein